MLEGIQEEKLHPLPLRSFTSETPSLFQPIPTHALHPQWQRVAAAGAWRQPQDSHSWAGPAAEAATTMESALHNPSGED